jgi:hypothetical protein
MNVFALLVYSCATAVHPVTGDLIAKTCRWDARDLYASQEACSRAMPPIGQPVFTDVMDDRKVEKTKCDPVPVLR